MANWFYHTNGGHRFACICLLLYSDHLRCASNEDVCRGFVRSFYPWFVLFDGINRLVNSSWLLSSNEGTGEWIGLQAPWWVRWLFPPVKSRSSKKIQWVSITPFLSQSHWVLHFIPSIATPATLNNVNCQVRFQKMSFSFLQLFRWFCDNAHFLWQITRWEKYISIRTDCRRMSFQCLYAKYEKSVWIPLLTYSIWCSYCTVSK